ncbi:tektin-3-like [Ischnura elegans]|uniref:tektin-3-like n=1 Tax=Ischnura elegans TaxID=197161 RepID=UPI001ED8AE98|nr:tektin-3-like [Ischnura elegans]
MTCRSGAYMQLHPWSSVGAGPCMEKTAGPTVPNRIANYFETPRPHPWRPTLGYENLVPMPLPSYPVTNRQMDPCYAPAGMVTEPIKFPSLVTGSERNPAHAARAALYTRFTPHEWAQSNLCNYSESDASRNLSERLRSEAARAMRQTEEETVKAQRESGRRLGERISDTTFWRDEVAQEAERLVSESGLLRDTKRALEKALSDLEAPLHIAQECLYHRENRQGIDLVHDQVEQALLKEVETLRNSQDRLRRHIDKVAQQLRDNRAAQHELERDVRHKEGALGIDHTCHRLNNFSPGINFYAGINKYDPTVSVPESWEEFSRRNVQRSQAERGRSAQARADADSLMASVAAVTWDHWTATNGSLGRRSSETLEAKNQLQVHLHKVQQEIFDIEKNMDLLRKAIRDKNNPMKVAQTRLEARTHRPDVELCRDNAQHRLVREVGEIEASVDVLHRRLEEAEAQHQRLLCTRSNLESDLAVKCNSLLIDRDKCLGLRRSFPITATPTNVY